MNRAGGNFTTERPVAVLMTFTAAVMFGFFSLKRLPVTLMPELTYPTITVRTEYPGAAPEEVENDISRPVEEALGVIGGLSRVSSVSRAGVSDVVLEFFWGTDMSDATQSTLEKLDLVFLPEEAERPLILHFDPSLDPIMELSFSGEGARFDGEQGLRRLRRIAELQIKRKLDPVKGVAAVRVRGGLEEEIHILLEEEKLRRSNLSIQQVIDRIRQENINVAGGTIKEGRAEYMVRTLNEYEDLDQIGETVVIRQDERNIRVKDLGEVVRSHKEREIITNTNGHESVQIDIYKEADSNMVALADRITELVGDLDDKQTSSGFSLSFGKQDKEKSDGNGEGDENDDAGLARQIFKAEGARLQIVADRSKFIESSIDEVRNTAVIGGLLAVLILFLFLRNVKTTAIIAVSIPMSLLITFAPLHMVGVSLNIMSLGGLALGIGMLVDSSIVVLESIFRCREEGDDVVVAAVRGTTEVRAAVFASTLTSIAVFFPMVFVTGIAGQAFGDLGLAVVISLLASYLVAVSFIPMLASRQKLQLQHFESGNRRWFSFASIAAYRAADQALSPRMRSLLLPKLYLMLRLGLAIVLEALGKLVLGLFLLLLGGLLRGLVPAVVKPVRFVAKVPLALTNRMFDGAGSLYPTAVRWTLRHPLPVVVLIAVCTAATWLVATRLETELLPEVYQGEFTFEVGLPVGTPIEETEAVLHQVETAILAEKQDIRTVLVTLGYDVTNAQRSDEGEHSAKFKVLLERGGEEVERRVIQRLRRFFDDIPDVAVRVKRPVLFSATTPIEVEIQGDDLSLLKSVAAAAREDLDTLPELTDVETTLKSGAPEVEVVYDRNKIMQYGLNLGEVARQVRDLVKGFEATRFNMKDRRIPILVRLADDNRENLGDIGRLTVNPGGMHPIPLNAVAQLTLGEGPSEVRRIDGRRVALINANIAGGSLGGAVHAIDRTLKKMTWPEGMTYSITGQNEEWERGKGSLYLALALSLFLVYVIMAAQFESLVHPFIIMFSIPLAFFGTVVGLKLLNINLSILVFLGMIMLAGIVVNNAIVLVDYINQLRRRGLATHEAIVTAGQVRLRPILMTTATTILGLLPMALGFGDGAEIRTPMAVAVICGLFSSTLLTLLVIPSLYAIVDSFSQRLFRSDETAETAREVPA